MRQIVIHARAVHRVAQPRANLRFQRLNQANRRLMGFRPRRNARHNLARAAIERQRRVFGMEQVDQLLAREPFPLPTLRLTDADTLRGLAGLLDFRFEHLKLENYQSWGKIAAPVAV